MSIVSATWSETLLNSLYSILLVIKENPVGNYPSDQRLFRFTPV